MEGRPVHVDPRDDPSRGPAAGEPPLERLPAEAARLGDKLYSLRSLDSAIHEAITREDYNAARQFAGIAREHALAALEAALECVALPPGERRRFSADAIQHAEQLLGLAPGTFSSFFAVNLTPAPRERKKALEELLVEVRNDIRNTTVNEAIRRAPSWLPAVIRIGSAVLVAAAVGAPLAALAVGESIVTEIVKTGIAVTACTIAAEVTNHRVERWLKPSDPSGPMTSTRPPHRVRPSPGPTRDVAREPGATRDPTPPDPAERDGRRLYPPSIHDPAENTLPSHDPEEPEPARPDPADPTDLDETPHRGIVDPFPDFDL
jgi:hypothetical protein